jgi:hypothetical protein
MLVEAKGRRVVMTPAPDFSSAFWTQLECFAERLAGRLEFAK